MWFFKDIVSRLLRMLPLTTYCVEMRGIGASTGIKTCITLKMVSADAYDIRQFTEISFVSSHRTLSPKNRNLLSLLMHASVDV